MTSSRRRWVITPNPKTSGGARWNYLAGLGLCRRQYGHDEEKDKEFVKKLFANVPVLDTGARGSTQTFAQEDRRRAPRLGERGLPRPR